MPDMHCALDKQQLLGLRVLSLTTVYPEGLGSVDLICFWHSRGWALAHMCVHTHAQVCACTPPPSTHVSHESHSLSFL